APARHHAEHDASGGLEVLRRRLAQRRRRRLAVAFEIEREEPGIAEKHVVGVQLIGLPTEAADRLQPEEEVRLRLRQTAFELVVGRSAIVQRIQLLGHRTLDLGERTAWSGRGDDLEEASQLTRIL